MALNVRRPRLILFSFTFSNEENVSGAGGGKHIFVG
jgi:hypothetical protein